MRPWTGRTWARLVHSQAPPTRFRVLIPLPRLRAYRFIDRLRVYLVTRGDTRKDWRELVAEQEERAQARQMPKAPKAGFYAVRKGKKPGIYKTWAECEDNVKGFPDAQFKKFPSQSAAEQFVNGGAAGPIKQTEQPSAKSLPSPAAKAASSSGPLSPLTAQAAAEGFDIVDGHLVVHTDGSARGNGKVGSVAGLGVWWGHTGKAREA